MYRTGDNGAEGVKIGGSRELENLSFDLGGGYGFQTAV